jgi:hypothetical protein
MKLRFFGCYYVVNLLSLLLCASFQFIHLLYPSAYSPRPELSHIYNLLGITVRSSCFLCFKMFIKEKGTTPWKIKPPQISYDRRGEVQFGQTSVTRASNALSTRAVQGGHVTCAHFLTNPN